MIALDQSRCYTAGEVGAALGHGPRWLARNRKRLEREGFPPPVSRVGRPRWFGADLVAWMNRPKARERAQAPNVHDLSTRLIERAFRR